MYCNTVYAAVCVPSRIFLSAVLILIVFFHLRMFENASWLFSIKIDEQKKRWNSTWVYAIKKKHGREATAGRREATCDHDHDMS